MKIDIFNTDKKYNIIYADPPWQFTKNLVNRGKARNVEKEYGTMSNDDIYNLPIANICEKDSVLCLWATSPKLPIAIKCMEEWGFKYKTCGFVWVKKNKKSNTNFWGMGFYTRQNAEFLLIGTKGKGVKRVNNAIHQIVESKIKKHSKKPDEVRNKIVDLFGDLPRIELFARQYADGWDCWGNEAPENIEQEVC